VRVAVAGAGYWGSKILRVLHKVDGAEIVAAFDPDPARVMALKRRFPRVSPAGSAHDMLEDPNIDAVIVAAPAAAHHSFAMSALRAGKHVFVEKPLALSAVDGREMAGLAREQGLVLMPGHTFLYSPPVERVRALIDAGALGKLRYMTMARTNLGLHRPDVNVVWDLASHDLAILRYWLGCNPRSVMAVGRACVTPLTDVAFVHLEYSTGLLVQIEVSWLAPTKTRRVSVVGSKRSVIYCDGEAEPLRMVEAEVTIPDVLGEEDASVAYRQGGIFPLALDAREPLAAELYDFCEAIRGGGTARVSPQIGVDVLDVLEAIDSSLALGGPVQMSTSRGSRIEDMQ
jgi:predicted dehydrogenase